jgi:hypothetical protein
MRREPTIPIFLWVATAALAHILWGGGAEQVVRVVEGGHDLARFAGAVRTDVQQRNRVLEISISDEAVPEPERPSDDEGRTEPEPPATVEPPVSTQPPVNTPVKDVRADRAREELEKPQQAPPEKTKKETKDPTAEAKPEPKQEEKPKEAKPAEVKPLQALEVLRRVAVKQQVQDPNEKDNPNAEFIADQAHHTDKRTQAKLTSTDQNEPDPTPGVAHDGPTDEPGSSHLTEVGQSDSAPGDPTRAFAEAARPGKDQRTESKGQKEEMPQNPSNRVFGEASPRARGSVAGAEQSSGASKAREAQQARAAAEAFDRTLDDPSGPAAMPAQSDEQSARQAQAASRRRAPPKGHGGRLPNLRGLGSLSLTPGGLNPNLTPMTALESIGKDQLQHERVADGERRRSKHRGSWRQDMGNHWKSAIQNYVASVQPGNQTELNTARVPFANYLNEIHQRLHDVFAHEYLGSLDNLPSDHPMNRPDLTTHLEIVLSREDGRIVRMGVTRASGVTAFDVGALESVQRASPYGAPPREILSPDGNVYLHWEFWRNPGYACSTYFARPYILRFNPTPAPAAPKPAQPDPGDEQHGQKQSPNPNSG